MTKHTEINCHFVGENIESGDNVPGFVNSNDHLADVFTKSPQGPRICVANLMHLIDMLMLGGKC